ncbi:hypothetical protein K2173_001895 [Erythroxylum novogranatense]|uniref:DUF668 domain-containing protein n=1 Tax=Erythroxylum novogranatense TaxID=1862640 RepID=A0AAV8SNW9_9ROSI|nr:hypothetical protein K2173_001895 [Erythroxylum novogranatense]
MVTDSRFAILWKNSGKAVPVTEKVKIGIVAFEVVSLMSKIVNIWHYMTDAGMCKLREEVVNSVGIRTLVSHDSNYLMELALNEILENLVLVARSVGMYGIKCSDPLFRGFVNFVDDPIQNYLQWSGWSYRLKKMERKVKKMERFIAFTKQLSDELEALTELERTFRRMQGNVSIAKWKLLDAQQRLILQRHTVTCLQEISPWVRTYDYVVRLLARSLLTILERIKYSLEINHLSIVERNTECRQMNFDCLARSHSFSALMHPAIHPSDHMSYGSSPGHLGLGKSNLMSEFDAKTNAFNRQQKLLQPFSTLDGKHNLKKKRRTGRTGPFKGCMASENDHTFVQKCKSSVGGSMRILGDYFKSFEAEHASLGSVNFSNKIYGKLAILSTKKRMFVAPCSTLGDAALAFHYANLILIIQRLASSPDTIDSDTRSDLYDMLPSTLRASLRSRLKIYAKSLAPSVHNGSLVTEWSVALARILDWLLPLALNTIRWQAERNFERKQEELGTNVLLVQTLHFANRAKTEAVITELLVGLNYICRINAVANERTLLELSRCRHIHGYMDKRDDHLYNFQ